MSETSFLAAVSFLIFAAISGALIQWLVSKVKAYKPPVSVLWFLWGMLICVTEVLVVPEIRDASDNLHIDIDPEHPLGLLGIGIAEAARVHSSVLLYVVLPILLYDATQQISWHHFRKQLRVALLLAIAGVMFQVLVIGLLMQYSFSRTTSRLQNASISSEPDHAQRMMSLPYAYRTEASPDHFTAALLGLRGLSLLGSSTRDKILEEDANRGNDSLMEQEPFSTHSEAFLPSERQLRLFWKGPHVYHVRDSPKGGTLRAQSTSGAPSMSFAMMTAAAVASTDPIAVISILEEVEAPAKFGSLFDSEALINDGSSIFLFTFFKSLTRGNTQTVGESIGRFATLLFAGPIFGLIIASLMYRWLKHYRWFPYDKTLAVVFGSYLVFFVAEIYLESSGPLTIVVYGLYFKAYAKAAFEAEAIEIHFHFVRGCATAATSVVFIMSGIASARMMWDAFTSQANLALPSNLPALAPEGIEDVDTGRGSPSSELWQVPVFYVYLNAARFLMIGCFYPLLRRWLEDFSWKEYLLLSWGGLRGSVCLILALLIEQDEHIDPSLSASAALYIASSAFFVLLVNGITFEFLYKLLKPYKTNPFKQVYLKKVMKLVDREYFNEVALLQQHWLFENSWALVYADPLVPRLGQIEISSLGKIHLNLPTTSRVLRDFEDVHLTRASPHPRTEVAEEDIEQARDGLNQRVQTVIHIQEDSASAELYKTANNVNAGSPRPLIRDSSKQLFRADEKAEGHTTAAVLQRLRRPPESSLDLEMNLRLLDQTEDEDDANEVEDLISRQHSKGLEPVKAREVLIRSRSPSEVSQSREPPPSSRNVEATPSLVPVPVITHGSSAGTPLPGDSQRATGEVVQEGAPLKRVPGYRYDSVVRIRSEPYSGLLDTAQVERFLSAAAGTKVQQNVPSPERDVAGAPIGSSLSPAIPRTMSVPSHLSRGGSLVNLGSFGNVAEIEEFSRMTSVPCPVKARDREGEILIMVINTMRQLYKRMYEQSFISGTVYVGFLSTSDVVTDFALVNVKQKSQIKAWREVFAASGGYYSHDDTSGELDSIRDILDRNDRACFGGVKRGRRGLKQRLPELLETITGFEVEWLLTASRLRRNRPSKACLQLMTLLRKVCCRCCIRSREAVESSSSLSLMAPKRIPRWQRMFRTIWTSLWSALGPRQTFPALDDLQLLCAFADVHDELLLRGDSGLRTMLGPRLLQSYQLQTQKAKQTILKLGEIYPDSFPYAMICHAALFLVNLKMQLVEEQYERGLLLAEDKEKIFGMLKQQLVSITKFHPPFLFT